MKKLILGSPAPRRVAHQLTVTVNLQDMAVATAVREQVEAALAQPVPRIAVARTLN
ncbi:hypothetical protein [Pararhodobacter zhoushanensis]|uniref:hypothetical protein n=1 Tax=Pararhodobacter zhoushanensis TaxID=2479545 RepID=UPI0013DFF664|nr:hypothetical protein [Pararhodobacter zhoushanensis]